MIDTVKHLRHFVTSEMMDSSEEELAVSYKLTKDDRLIAALFIKLLPITQLISSKYTAVEKETVISFAMMMIEDLSNTFDPSQKIKFVTYYSNSLKRLMFGLMNPYKKKKRICPTEVCSIDKIIREGQTIGDFIPDKLSLSDRIDAELYDSLIESFDDTTSKILICLAQGYNKVETASLLNINIQTVHKTIKCNKSVLAELLDYKVN